MYYEVGVYGWVSIVSFFEVLELFMEEVVVCDVDRVSFCDRIVYEIWLLIFVFWIWIWIKIEINFCLNGVGSWYYGICV